MEILTTNAIQSIVFFLKLFVVLVGIVIVGINYFHAKESRKMERKLRIALPGSVIHLMSFHMLLSLIFVFASTIFLFVL